MTSLCFAFAIVTYKVLISDVQPSDSVIHTHIHIHTFLSILFHYGLP